MTTEELLKIINDDPVATLFVNSGNDTGCAEYLTNNLPPIQNPIEASEVLLIAARRGRWGPIAVTAEMDSAEFLIRSVCRTLVDWVKANRAIDFDLVSVQQMITVLKSASLVDDSDIVEIKRLGLKKQIISHQQVGEAMKAKREMK